jgi:hypothetical protein
MDKPEIKVTDRRMFTETGELREEFRFLESASTGDESRAPEEPLPAAAESPERSPAPPPDAAQASTGESYGTLPAEVAGMPAASELGLIDLIGMLAENVALCLGELRLPDGRTAEDLGQARSYIDLLGVLEKKTRGNRDAEEDAVLGDLLYRLRVRYVQKQAKPS